jgi:hypothetical protein
MRLLLLYGYAKHSLKGVRGLPKGDTLGCPATRIRPSNSGLYNIHYSNIMRTLLLSLKMLLLSLKMLLLGLKKI